MLRVGLTGELGSGKSTVARMLAARGAVVLSSDEMGRAMMQPGHAVFEAIVERFGHGVVLPGGELDRGALAKLAFDPVHPRVEELNGIVHPEVLEEQARQVEALARTQPDAMVVIESALIFATRAGGRPWRERFDVVVLVTAPENVKIARFVARAAQGRSLSEAEREELEADARGRLARQHIAPEDAAGCLELDNSGDETALEASVEALWRKLSAMQRG
jgi:dephospho-CoA kinase